MKMKYERSNELKHEAWSMIFGIFKGGKYKGGVKEFIEISSRDLFYFILITLHYFHEDEGNETDSFFGLFLYFLSHHMYCFYIYHIYSMYVCTTYYVRTDQCLNLYTLSFLFLFRLLSPVRSRGTGRGQTFRELLPPTFLDLTPSLALLTLTPNPQPLKP